MQILNSFSAFAQIGGSSKSTLVQAVEAGVVLSGRKVCVVDADPANAGYTVTTGAEHSVKLRALARDGTIIKFVRDAAAAGSTVLTDCGAGTLSMDAEFIFAMSDFYAELGSAGYTHVTAIPITSNKAVSEDITRASIKRHVQYGEVVVVKTDVSRSGNFPSWLTGLGQPIVDFRCIAAGFIDLRLRSKMPLSSWLTSDDTDQHFAKAAFAAAAIDLLSAPSFTHLVTSAGLANLTAIKNRVSAGWIHNPASAADGVDAVVAQLILRALAYKDLGKAARADPTHPYRPIVDLDAGIADLVRDAALKYPPIGPADDRDQAAS